MTPFENIQQRHLPIVGGTVSQSCYDGDCSVDIFSELFDDNIDTVVGQLSADVSNLESGCISVYSSQRSILLLRTW